MTAEKSAATLVAPRTHWQLNVLQTMQLVDYQDSIGILVGQPSIVEPEFSPGLNPTVSLSYATSRLSSSTWLARGPLAVLFSSKNYPSQI